MKKLLVTLGIIIALLLSGILIVIYGYLGAPFDPEQSEYFYEDPPENIQRTLDYPDAGQRTTFVEKSYDTGGDYTLVEVELEPGGGNALHYHEVFTETFMPVNGTLGLKRDGEEIHAEPGDTVMVDINQEHRFFNPSDTDSIMFRVLLEPGAPGFEKALYIMYGLARDGMTDEDGLPENIFHTATFVVYGDTRSRSILSPLMWRIAGRAQRESIEQELLESYYFGLTEE